MFLLQLICLYKLPSSCLWKKLTQHLLWVFLGLLSPGIQCSSFLVCRWPQPSSIPEFPGNDTSGTSQCRRWRILITFLEILFFAPSSWFLRMKNEYKFLFSWWDCLEWDLKKKCINCSTMGAGQQSLSFVIAKCQCFQNRRIMPFNFCLSIHFGFP